MAGDAPRVRAVGGVDEGGQGLEIPGREEEGALELGEGGPRVAYLLGGGAERHGIFLLGLAGGDGGLPATEGRRATGRAAGIGGGARRSLGGQLGCSRICLRLRCGGGLGFCFLGGGSRFCFLGGGSCLRVCLRLRCRRFRFRRR
ncbi:MAG: hypothetical protein RID93_31730, partial [Sandaracinaceae bacterium]